MNKEELQSWRTIVEILKLTGNYDFYMDEVSKIANLLRNIGSDKE